MNKEEITILNRNKMVYLFSKHVLIKKPSILTVMFERDLVGVLVRCFLGLGDLPGPVAPMFGKCLSWAYRGLEFFF